VPNFCAPSRVKSSYRHRCAAVALWELLNAQSCCMLILYHVIPRNRPLPLFSPFLPFPPRSRWVLHLLCVTQVFLLRDEAATFPPFEDRPPAQQSVEPEPCIFPPLSLSNALPSRSIPLFKRSSVLHSVFVQTVMTLPAQSPLFVPLIFFPCLF